MLHTFQRGNANKLSHTAARLADASARPGFGRLREQAERVLVQNGDKFTESYMGRGGDSSEAPRPSYESKSVREISPCLDTDTVARVLW